MKPLIIAYTLGLFTPIVFSFIAFGYVCFMYRKTSSEPRQARR